MKKLTLVVAGALIDPKARILIAKRPAGKPMANLWEFPGGKIEPGESPEAALIRELAEELDIEVAENDLQPLAFASHSYESFHLLMPLFVCRQWRRAPKALVHADLRWVYPDELDAYAMPPADEPLIVQLRAHL